MKMTQGPYFEEKIRTTKNYWKKKSTNRIIIIFKIITLIVFPDIVEYGNDPLDY